MTQPIDLEQSRLVASIRRSGINGNKGAAPKSFERFFSTESLLFVEVELMETGDRGLDRTLRRNHQVASIRRSGINGNSH